MSTPLNHEQIEAAFAEASALMFARYTSLVKAGFSPAQALEIIKYQGLTIPDHSNPTQRSPQPEEGT